MKTIDEVVLNNRLDRQVNKSISADADKIVSGLLVCKPLADEVYNKLRLLALQDEETFRNKRFQERVIANNNSNCGG